MEILGKLAEEHPEKDSVSPLRRIPRSPLLFFLLTFFLFASCQKEIIVDLPPLQPKICVDGKIEPGLPPYVILTNNMPYFGTTNINDLENLFIHNAFILVSDGINADTLTEICTQSLPDSLIPVIAAVIGIDSATLQAVDYCLYTTLNPQLWGVTGRTYNLTIDVNGKRLTSSTSILPANPIDSLYPKYYRTNAAGDSLGFIFGIFSEPSPVGDCYRWLAMRVGKDQSFICPPGGPFDDKFIDGQTFEFAYNRGTAPGSTAPDDTGEEEGWYKKGDTVIVKLCKIDRAVYDFFHKAETAIYSQGNPFAAPSSVPSNIYPRKDALGVWCGYGPYLDTLIFK